MNDYYVYMYLRAKDSEHGPKGSPYYIGKGKGRRSVSLQHSVNRPSDPSRVVIIEREMTEVDAFQAEILLIYRYGRIDKKTGCLRNRTDGGEGQSGRILSREQRAKIGEFHRGRKLPENVIQAMRVRFAGRYKGRKLSEETKKKIGVANSRKRVMSEDERQKRSESSRKNLTLDRQQKMMKRRKELGVSEETRRKISKALKGHPVSQEVRSAVSEASKRRKPWTEEERQAISQRNKGLHRSDETRQRISEANRQRPPISEETRLKMKKSWEIRKANAQTLKDNSDQPMK